VGILFPRREQITETINQSSYRIGRAFLAKAQPWIFLSLELEKVRLRLSVKRLVYASK
jgi:hypothetical protein